MKQTIGEIYRKSIDYLQKKGIERPEISVQYLLSDVLNIPRLQIFLQFDNVMEETLLAKMRGYLTKRAAGEPVQYITGTMDFYNAKINVNKHVLIPRPETEILVDKALEILKKDRQKTWRIADLGTGSGNISIAVARELKDRCLITAIDISENATLLARENAVLNGVEEFIDFQNISFDDYLEKKPALDMVLANPPYVDRGDRKNIAKHVEQFEPHCALFGPVSGLDYPLAIIEKTSYLMKDDFSLLMEIGWDQSDALLKKCADLNIANVDFIEDYNNFKRVLRIIKKR